MQWVVTTGASVEDARERALDVLGIDEGELEFEVLDPGSTRLFGLRTTPARVRARVRPTSPRPKVDRRTRRTKSNSSNRRRKPRRTKGGPDDATDTGGDESSSAPAPKKPQRSPAPEKVPAAKPQAETQNRPEPVAPPAPDTTPTSPAKSPSGKEGSATAMSDITLQEQEPTAVSFVTGLVEAFGADATVTAEHVDDEALEIRVEGEDLGLLVGPRGTTLSSIAELTRTSVAQQHSGRLEGRLRVDIAGYRAKRKEALIRFAAQVADKVLEGGKSVALEPMSPPDRKIVHDAINEIDGVHTSSRGEDRNRHVVVHPD